MMMIVIFGGGGGEGAISTVAARESAYVCSVKCFTRS